MGKRPKNCPNGHGQMETRRLTKGLEFRGVDLSVEVEHDVCPVCGLEAGSIEQAARTQKAISDAYRKKNGLLTSEEIRRSRKNRGWTQNDLAETAGVGIVSIKRWEGGLIQTRAMDNALRAAFQGKTAGDLYTGNRPLSLPRIKLVLREFETRLRKRLLVKGDKFLYTIKYLCYADMLAFRELGRSMTGATYAWLPHGPQLNNYRDLLEPIMEADDSSAEPLSPEEERIITKISKAFPRKNMAYHAAHNEKVWEKRDIGTIIPYSDADKLKAL